MPEYKKGGCFKTLKEVCNSLFLLFERSQATQSGLRKRKAPERRGTELNGVNGDIVCGKVFRPPLSAPQLSRALRREQQRATYPNAKHRRKHLREFARQAQKIYPVVYTHRISSTEPIFILALCRCRAVCGVLRRDKGRKPAQRGWLSIPQPVVRAASHGESA